MLWYLGYIIIYFSIMFGIGFYYFRKVKSADDYLIAGWNMDFWPIVGTIISTFCGASVFIGWVGLGYNVGISGYIKFALMAAAFSILLVIVFAGTLRRQKLYTMADLFSERFGSKVGIFPSVLSAFIYSVPTLAMQMVGMATIWVTIFEINTATAIFLSFVLILGFTILGGLPGTIITDALQAIIIVVGIFALAIASVNFAGGAGTLMTNSDPALLAPFGAQGAGEVVIYALSVGPFYVLWQSTWQRIFASKTEKVAKTACTTGFLLCAFIGLIPFIIGIAAKQYVPADIGPDMIFAYVTRQLLPPYVGGLIYVALLAALMTSADSFILQGSSNLTIDLYQRLLNPKASNTQLLYVSRITVVIISVLGLFVAYQITDITSIYQWALRLTATTLLFPFLATMFWKRITTAGAIGSMMIAAIVTTTWPYLGLPLDVTLAGFLSSLISMVTISLLTKHRDAEQVKAIYFEDLDSASR